MRALCTRLQYRRQSRRRPSTGWLPRIALAILRPAAALVALVALGAQSAQAHTVSYGYVAGTQPGNYTFWFGTYHPPSTANYTEGQIQLTCGGGFAATVSFTTLVSTKPAGLVGGVNYFYDAGYGGEPGSPLYASTPTHTAGGVTGPVAAWQGVTFTNITYPGTCTFKYIPIASPTAVWDPNGANATLKGIGSGSFLLTEGITITKTSPQTTYAAPGTVLNYSYAVKNTGNMVLTAPLSVADNKTTVACPPFSPLAGTSPVVNGLATGATITCTASYTVTQADIDAGSVTNIASATSGTSTTPYTSPNASLTVTATQSPAMTVAKSTTATTFAAVGDVLPYAYLVKNTGNTTLTTAITVADNKIPAVTCPAVPSGGLSPGGTITCTGSYSVTQADLDAGKVSNTAASKSGPTTSPSVSVTVTATQSPALTIVKSTTSTGYSTLGAAIPYNYLVKNSGNVTLTTAISITDNKIASVSCPALPSGGLAPNATLTCTATYLITQADLDAGGVINTASAKSGSTISPSVSLTVTGTKSPALSVRKDTTTTTYASLPTSILYTFVATNIGNVTITNPVTVSDTKITTVTCPALPSGGLAPGSAITCSGSYAITQADIDGGSVVNTATAASGVVTSAPDTHTLTATQTRALTLTKSGSPAAFAAPGVSIVYTYVVKNSGNVTIPQSAAISIADNKIASVMCPAIPSGGLAPAATLTCSATYVTTQADVDAGSITNQAKATDGVVTSPSVSFTATANQTSSLSVAKSSTETTFTTVGQVIHYSFLVTNTGNTTEVAAVTISDSKIASVTCPAMPSGGLAPAATLTCTATYTITQADLDGGSVVNTASAKSGTTVSTPPVTHTLPATKSPALTVVKTSTATAYSAPGTVIPYSYKVANSGNVTLTTAVSVTDSKIASVTCPALPAGGLAPNAFVTCTGSYTVTQADIDAGSIVNTASAASGAVTSPTVSLSLSATQSPALTVVKSTASTTFATVGATISYSYKVTNSGNVTLTAAVNISDNKIASVACPALPASGLAPGAFVTCSGVYSVTQADLDAGAITNTASAKSGSTVSPTVSATVTATQSPALTVNKTASAATFATAGTSITYSYKVTNSGNVTLASAVTIADNKIASISCPALPSGGLAPGAFITCSAPYVTTQADVDAGGITNLASAKSGATTSPSVSLTVTAAQSPALSVVKSTTATTYSSLPTTIPYTFTVTNSGNVSLSSPITISDGKIATVTCPSVPAGGLAPAGVTTCTGSYVVTQADLDAGNIVNTAQAKSGSTTSPTVTHTLTGSSSPQLSIAKVANKAVYSSVGESISYSYTVTNTGNVSLTSAVTVSDNRIASVGCPATVLAPTKFVVCTGVYSVTQADIDGGNVVNTASAAASTGAGPAVSPSTSATVKATQSPKLTVTKAAAAGPYNTVGQTITYTFVATNAGNVTLTTPVTIADNRIATVTCAALPAGGLAPGSTLNCSGTYTLTQADLDSGSVNNSAMAQSGPTVSTPPTTHTQPIAQTRALTMTKTPSQATFITAGTIISYSYAVKNAGNVTIPATAVMTVSDTKIATVACPAIPAAGLAPNATLTCSAAYTITQGDVDAGSVTNNATAKDGTSTSPQVSATVTASQAPALSVAKTSTETTYSAVGQVMHYSFAVTNTGNVTQTTPISVSDSKITTVVCPVLSGGLAPAALLTCTATYTVTQGDLDAGAITNIATAKSTTATSQPVTHILPATQVRSLSIVKSATPTSFNKPGVVIAYAYVVKNTGNITIPSSATLSVSDNKIAAVSCPPIGGSGLAPNATISCTGSATTTQADVDAGSITNTASATDGTVTSPTTSATVTAAQSPSISIVKSTTETSFNTVGQVLHYAFLVTNTGNVTQTGALTINDSRIPSVTCPSLPAGGLSPAAQLTCNATYTITQADLDAGSVDNTASATVGITTSTPPVTHKIPAVKTPALSVVKSTPTKSFNAVGTIITYSYKATNTGNVTLVSSLTVDDDRIATVSCPALPGGGLAPGNSLTCTGTYTITQADLDAGGVTNKASAASGATVSPAVSVTVPAVKSPALSVAKASTTTAYSTVGTVVPYTYTVKNIGNLTLLSAVTIADNKIPAVSCPALGSGGLVPGSTITCTGTYTITQADLDAGSLVNTATASSGAVSSAPATLSIAAVQSPALSVIKTSAASAYAAVGEKLSYSYKVTNAGNVTLTSPVSIADNKIATVTCPSLPAGGLAPAAFITCSGVYTIAQADIDAGSLTNSASAKSGSTTSPSVTLTLPATLSPALSMLKTSTTSGLISAGQLVTYSYRVTNSGNVTLTSAVTVSDNKIATITCPALPSGGLSPTVAIVCSGSYTVTQADIDAGGVTNTATAKSGSVVSSPVSLKINAIQAPALTLVKTADKPNETSFSAVGEIVRYTYIVTNTGNVTLTAPIGIYDYLTTEEVGCPAPNPAPGGLPPGRKIVCAGAYVVTQADMDAGFIINTAFATADQLNSPTVSVTIRTVQKPNFTIVKSLAAATAVNNGDGSFTAAFAVKVANTGNVTLKAMQLVDDYASGLPAGARVDTASIQTVESSVRGALLTANAAFDAKSTKPNLLTDPGEALAPGEQITVAFKITFDPGLNKPGAAFNNTAVGSAVFPDGSSSGLRVSKSSAATVPFIENHALVVTKNTPKSDVIRGELVPYTITVRNDYDPKLVNISIVDNIPAGFTYRAGSATVQGVRREPNVAGRVLTWPGSTVEKGKPVTITLLLVVGGGAGEGEFTNEAWATSQYGSVLSNVAKAVVRIVPDPTFDCTDIIGKVFDDTNRNGYPDAGERGIANVRVSTVTGQLITTDSEGRFHIACADIPNSDRGSNFIIKLDDRTLPTGYRLTTENPRVIRITRGKMAKINFGASLHRVVRLDIADAAFDPGSVKLVQQWFDNLQQVFDPLKQERSVLRLGYRRAIDEDLVLVQQRVRALQALLLEMWKRDGSGYELSIETEIYVGKSASKQ